MITLIYFIIAWILQNCIHELSHLYFAWKVHNRKPLGFYPYPHFYMSKFYFARCSFVGPLETKPKDLIWISPVIWSSFLLFSYCIIAVILHEMSIFITCLMFCSVCDILWWFRGLLWGSDQTDGKRWLNGSK